LVPETFDESDAKLIANCEEVRFKSFSTGIHRVETAVMYKSDL